MVQNLLSLLDLGIHEAKDLVHAKSASLETNVCTALSTHSGAWYYWIGLAYLCAVSSTLSSSWSCKSNIVIKEICSIRCYLFPQTHTPFNGPLSGTTRVSRYQKGKTNLDFTEARDSEWQWHQLGHMQVCISLQITMPAPHHSVFTGRMPFLPPSQQCQSTF